ncbi:Conserved_hypothetical protein [Hexamita inflata]|uniref:Uncharacterized protein n=1 Tax=Hexamita inflata TaxID=28002 RepID=A0AA86RGI4_9EUKA|nr:Conserved hypothetical protein [Hexamita inflata]CAI9966695.1 Conserved hypothetical protein [Hexamita inflata]
MNVNTFSLFGFSIDSQTITDSNINISIQFQVLTGALLCIICDVDVKKCSLILIASGQQISGVIVEPKYSFIIQQSFIQYRIRSIKSSGLTNIINESSISFAISQCQLIGSNLLQSSNNGYIASAILVHILLNITQFDICVDSTSRFGQNSVSISIIGSDSVKCDLCDSQFIVYGLCGELIKYSENINGMYQCVYPFEYIDNQCVCVAGYLLNNTKCINVVESLNTISNLISNSSNNQIQQLEQKVDIIESSITVIDQSILSNYTEIENRIISNFSKSDANLFINTSILDNRIYQNITSIKYDILMNQITADANLLTNTTVLDWRIFNNISQVYNIMNNFTQYYNDSLFKQQQTIEQQQNIINNLTQQINCSSNSGYSMVNGSCVQVSCAISGQQSINGVCQCVNINSIIQSGSCVCPVNSQVVGIACVCSISGQIMQNGQCLCATTGAFVLNNVCTCGVNSINISNTCSCPSGASLVNGVCTCVNINAYISENQCVCPTYSLLVGNTCTCPSNSQIINNECVCNLIIGQIMNNNVCQCQTTGAFVTNEACTCGVNAVNVSNTCACPTNSSLLNNICTCDKIIGQSIINETCQCPTGQSVVNNTCKQINYEINISNFKCSQELFTQQFDIQTTTNQISASSNFSAGYVFSADTVIQNAFIDISDNVYSITTYPLFQSQSTFTNLKIQFGTQALNGGSLLLSSSSVLINQMNIISRPGSQLTVNSALNILTSSSTSANLTNLLVNLSFAPSTGNIALINIINGGLNISKYQIQGDYFSTGTVAMISININTAFVNVNQVTFKASAFNVGNSSSYLFGNIVTTSTILINNFAVILGSSFNFSQLGSISTTSLNSYYYQFGGILACINGNSVLNVNNVILDSYQQFSTSYVSYSGFLVGYNTNSNSNIIIKNICLQQNMTSTTLQFNYFGFIGYNQGNTSIQNASFFFQAQSAYFNCFGIIGYQYSNSQYAEIINLIISVKISSGSGSNIGSIFGIQYASNCSVQNASLIGGHIYSSSVWVGGFIGEQICYTRILNSSIQQMNISSSQSYVGGFIAYCYQSLYLINSKIQSVRISGTYAGIIASYITGNGNIYFTNSQSAQIYQNEVLRNDCIVLSNWQSGC